MADVLMRGKRGSPGRTPGPVNKRQKMSPQAHWLDDSDSEIEDDSDEEDGSSEEEPAGLPPPTPQHSAPGR